MHEGNIVQSVIELHDEFLSTMYPFDSIVAHFFRKRRYIGSSDRRTIANMAYEIFRSYAKMLYLTSKITQNHARFIVLAYLIVAKRYDKNKLSAVFNGKKYAPVVMSEFEKKWIDTIEARLDSMPRYARLNYPEWLESRLYTAFPENFEEEVQALNNEAYVDIRVNTLKTDVESVFNNMIGSGIDVEKLRISPIGLRVKSNRLSHANPLLASGCIEIQDEGSQVVALTCDAKPVDTVVDMCAGAGGKTLALAALMNNKGRIYATDVSENRLQSAVLRLRRAGVSNTYCNLLTRKWIKRHISCADVVLVDAPCSGSGTWRRNPDMRFRLTSAMLEELTEKQSQILDEAKSLVNVGGKLVYATCSVFQEENENIVAQFLAKNQNFVVEPQTIIGSGGDYIKMSPYKTGTDGFFCAKLRRVA